MRRNLSTQAAANNRILSLFATSGTQDTTLSDTANGVLYGCFAIAGFFAGSVHVRSLPTASNLLRP